MILKQKINSYAIGTAVAVLPALSVLSPNLYGAAIPVLALLGIASIEHKKIIWDKNSLLFILSLIILCFTSALWSQDNHMVVEKAVKVAGSITGGYLLWHLCGNIGNAQAERIKTWVVNGFALGAILLFIELFGQHSLYRFYKGYDYTAHVIPSIVNQGAVILSLMFWPAFYIEAARGRGNLIAATGICFFSILVCLGKSETAMASFLIGAIALWLSLRSKITMQRAVKSAVLCGTLLAPFIALALFPLLSGKLSSWESASAAERLEIWHGVANYALQKPLTGYGLEATRLIHDFNFENLFYPRDFILHPHNNFLQVWLEFGVIGALWLSGFLYFALQRIKNLPQMQSAFTLTLFCALVMVSLVGYGLWQSWWIAAIFTTAATMRLAFHENSAVKT